MKTILKNKWLGQVTGTLTKRIQKFKKQLRFLYLSSKTALILTTAIATMLVTYFVLPTSSFKRITTKEPLSNSVVKITSDKFLTSSRGGTGFVVKTDRPTSLVLTNAHVCRSLSKTGNIVVLDKNKAQYLTKKITEYEKHDLCAIELFQKIAEGLTIAPDSSEELRQDFPEIKIIGHPFFVGMTQSEGTIGSKEIIMVIDRIQPCTEEDFDRASKNKDSQTIIACIFLGGKPIFRPLEVWVTSAAAAPGNSGSPVLNKKNQVVGVLFAGVDGSTFPTFIVPLEFLLDFLKQLE